ncbi:efflux RND transporter periplasmic adaptor subunit [Desulfopila aestuarii]|uniref:RND family efflux transporter, MFP subunit n=1 Tax=Desulfopila aestuarii DSM 18488 TaxID=1121416 RepID=A0A1M7Y8S8_9BACT|nr:efflux RND transporter periplasmic adaptor subunit [Desulfopila aestuarii]SHO49042.1 RND family efflux transporter, MFP subunit [Desulfopila aestuarii DSM 18488]
MNMIRPEEHIAPGEIHRKTNKIAGFILHFLLPAVILACGVAITVYLMRTSPEARPVKRPPNATLVEVRTIQSGLQTTMIEAMGEIVAAREVDLKPRVGGEVIEVSNEFVPGGHFEAGETVLKIDQDDYRLTLQQLESEVQKAESDLAIEMGNQSIAAREFALVNEKVRPEERALILREPQLVKLKASLAVARSKLEQARLDLARTEVKAPFNGVIENRSADVGARVNESTALARLVGADVFWLRLTLPVDQLQWLKFPTTSETGSEVRIYPQSNTDQFRTGKLIRLEAALETQGRMAQLLVEINDPLCLKPENSAKPKLLLGSFVKAEIVGIPINSAVKLDRSHIHDGNKVWLMDDKGQLQIREVDILFRNRDQVIVADDLANGERLVVSQLSSPIAGIALQVAGDKKTAVDGQRQGKKGKMENAGGNPSAQ